ncbi:unnamed protein product, partial [Polarella glacialis]
EALFSHCKHHKLQQKQTKMVTFQTTQIWKITDPVEQVAAGSSAASAAVPPQSGSNSCGSRAPAGVGLPSCNYLQDVRRLAAMPGVIFAGVFANARQLPHLAAELKKQAT